MIEPGIFQGDARVSRSAGVAAALSSIFSQKNAWVFESPRYLPNHLIYQTILDVHHRNHAHPPYHRLEDHGYTYLGSIVYNLKQFNLYLDEVNGEKPILAARCGYNRSQVMMDGRDNLHPVLREIRCRAEARGLWDTAPLDTLPTVTRPLRCPVTMVISK